MADPCLPFCHWPTFANPCDNIAHELVCCIKWTMPCPGAGGEVTCTFKTSLFADGGDPSYAEMRLDDGLWTPHYLDEMDLCQTVKQGKIFWASSSIPGYDPNYGPGQTIVLHPEFYESTGPIGMLEDVYGYTEADCNGVRPGPLLEVPGVWPDRLTEISGITETDSTEDFAIERFALPGIRWSCQTGGMILFEVGWCVWDIRMPYSEIAGGGSTGWNSFVPISTGLVPSDWYSPADPFTLQGVESSPNGFDSVVTPVVCNYEPCGDPLDCFASCISGTKECDGSTPAHVPTIFFTINILGCCLNGTYTLTYQSSGPHGAGYYGGGSCESIFGGGVTHYLDVALTCQGTGGTGDVGGPGDPAILWIDMTTTFPSDPPLEWQWITSVTLGCSDGVLNEASGTFTGSDCGLIGDGGWVIHG